MDPLTVIGVATTAFNTIKQGINAGKDIESMYGTMGKWMGSISDLRHMEKMNKNPPIFKKIFNGASIEQEAMDIFIAKKKAEEMEKELKSFISLVHGPSAWQELIRLQVQIRKDRQAQVYAQQEARQNLLNWAGIILLILLLAGTSIGVLYMVMLDRGMI